MNREYLEYIRGLLQKDGYHPTKPLLKRQAGIVLNIKGRVYKSNYDAWQIRVCRLGELEKFARTIGFPNRTKQDKLIEAIALVSRRVSNSCRDMARKIYEE